MAKQQPEDLASLYEDAYTREHGFDRHDPADEWYGLTCRVSRIDGQWSVKVANSAGAPFMDGAFEAAGETVEQAFAEALEKLIAQKGRQPLPKTPHELDMEKFRARVQKSRRDAEAKKAEDSTAPPGPITENRT